MMTLTLSPDLEAALADQARRRGTTPELLAEGILREQVLPPAPQPAPAPPSAPPDGPRNLAEFLGDYIGCIDSSEHVPGGAQMSTDMAKKFAAGMVKKRREGRL